MNLNLQDVCWDGLFPYQPEPRDFTEFAPIHQAKTDLATGAGGSIGAARARAIHALGLHTLILLDSSDIYRDLVISSNKSKRLPNR
jgi:FlaA1/EpsC-like NDP-sugar epimerase